MKLKVCGMKYQENIIEVAKTRPDFLGFIFFEKSPRNFNGEIPQLDKNIKIVGVFVDASIQYVLQKVTRYNFNAIQLHGEESVVYVQNLRKALLDASSKNISLIKVFSIKNEFDFDVLKHYEEWVDYFLFDTRGETPGGTGLTFNWQALENYPSKKPYFLSGGIGLEQCDELKIFMETEAAKYCSGIDVNSRFELDPGKKDSEQIAEFKKKLKI